MRTFLGLLMLLGLWVWGSPLTISAMSDFGGNGSSFSCASSDAQIMQNAGSSVSVGGAAIYTGFHQATGNNQNPVVARFDSGVRTWCRDDYETTGDDGRGAGLYWDGTKLIGVFSATGTQPGPNYTRWTSSGWLTSYGQGGGPRVSILLNINPSTGDPINGTYLRATRSNGSANSLAVTGIALNGDSVLVTADSWFSPLNTDKSPMTCDGSSPFIYTIEFSSDFSSALGAEAVNCVDNSPAPGSLPQPGIPAQIAPVNGISVNSETVEFTWQADQNASRYWLWVGDANNNSALNVDNINAAVSCTNGTCTYTTGSLPFGTYVWYVLAGNELKWSTDSNGFFRWSSGATFSLGRTVSALTPSSGTVISDAVNWGPFEWQADPDFDWYGLYITKPNNAAPLFEWYSAAADNDALTCGDTTCKIDLHLQLTRNGSYTWYVIGWDDVQGAGPWSTGIPFSVNMARPNTPANITVNTEGASPIVTWQNDPNAGYYQIYVGKSDFSREIFFNWNRSSQLCSGDVCTLPLNNPGAGEYVVYIQAWGPGGFNAGDANVWSNPATFNVSGGSQIDQPQALTSTSP